ncbi:hypothetical protein EJB05_17263, partial [Eragrostis curvula]
MNHRRFDLSRDDDSSSRGSGEASTAADVKEKSTEAAKKSSDVVTSSTLLSLETEPDNQSPPRSVDNNAEKLEVVDHEQGPDEIEGLDWDDTKLVEEIDTYLDQFTYDLPPKDDEDFWYYNGEEQLQGIKQKLALHRINGHRASQGAKLQELMKDADLMEYYPPKVLKDEGYYKHYEQHFEWYFDPEYSENAGFQDYQRMVRDDGHYLEYNYYSETLCTHEGDQEFVDIYEKLSSETKWIVNFLEVERSEWKRYKCIWKRVTKDKMDFVEALEQLYNLDVGAMCRFDIKCELGYIPGSGVLKYNYETYLADINEEVKEDEARSMIIEAVKTFVPKRKTYYDYAKTKLDIAREIGMILPK